MGRSCERACMTVLIVSGILHTAEVDIPVLNWAERSDWVNVKTDVSPAAMGDGSHDDGPALQAALDMIDGLGGNADNPKVIYLPAGRYRITRSLVFPNSVGMMVVGHGRETIIEWDGASGEAMAISDGAHSAAYIGIAWDGRNRAAHGIYHKAVRRFECKVLHQHESFRNLTESGIRTADRSDWEKGGDWWTFATSESEVRNCLFESMKTGVAVSFFNYYNWYISGCEFRGCEVGIRAKDYGQAFVNACHFENSTFRDIELSWSHGHAVRNCTSTGSNLFLWGQDMTMQNCAIGSWAGRDNWINTIFNSNRGPFLVFDCSFSDAPYSDPPMYLQGEGIKCVLSNIRSTGSSLPLSVNAGNKMTEIPRGTRMEGSTLDPRYSFLVQSIQVPSKIYNVKAFGAVGNGSTDDADAIQEAIDSAAAFGNGAAVYFPASGYVVGKTLLVSGSDFTLCGTG